MAPHTLHVPPRTHSRSVWPYVLNLAQEDGRLSLNPIGLNSFLAAVSIAQLVEHEGIPMPCGTMKDVLTAAILALTESAPGYDRVPKADADTLIEGLGKIRQTDVGVVREFVPFISFSTFVSEDSARSAMTVASMIGTSSSAVLRALRDDDAYAIWRFYADIPPINDDVCFARANKFCYLLWTRYGLIPSARWCVPPPWSYDVASKLLDAGILTPPGVVKLTPEGTTGFISAAKAIYPFYCLAFEKAAARTGLSAFALYKFALEHDW